MVATPYPGQNAAYENPSIFASNDGVNWSPPKGVSNPIARPAQDSYAYGSSDFRVDEFVKGISVKRLCRVVGGDGYTFKTAEPTDSIDWLNALLQEPGLYDHIAEKKKPLRPSEHIERLYATYHETRRGEDLKALNRSVLEEFYPQETPISHTYLSDPDVAFCPLHGLRVYYRLVEESCNRIFFIESKNGHDWTQPVETIAVPSHHLISPALVTRGTQYVMYSVKLSDDQRDTAVERRESEDGIEWASPEIVSILDTDEKAWHLDGVYIAVRKEFWLLFYGYPSRRLYLAVSKDGLRFNTLPVPLLMGREDANASWDSGLYRSTFQISGDDFLLWYTGTKGTASHIGFTKADLHKITALIR